MNTTAHENIRLIKQFYRYARKGDSDNAHAFLSSDIEFRERTPSLGSSDKHTGAAAVLEEALGPIALPGGRACQFDLIHRVVAKHWTQQIHEAETQIGVQHPVDGGSRRMLNEPVNQPGLPAGLG